MRYEVNKENYKNLKVGDLVEIKSNNPISKVFECNICQISEKREEINGEVTIVTDNDLIMPLCLTERVTIYKLDNFKKIYTLGEEEILDGSGVSRILRAKHDIKILEDDCINKRLDKWYIDMCNRIRKDFNIKNYFLLIPVSKERFGVIPFDAETNGEDFKKVYVEPDTNNLFILAENEGEVLNDSNS